MTTIEELYYLTARKGMNITSKPAPNGGHRIHVTWPGKGELRNAKFNSRTDLEICCVDSSSPELAAADTLRIVKTRLEDFERRKIYQ